MQLDANQLQLAIDNATEVADYYRLASLNGDHLQKSIDDLRRLMSDRIGMPIHIRELPILAEGKSIKAIYLKFTDQYVIYHLAGLDFQDKRFVLCKELFHVVLDCEECRSTDIVSHIENMISSLLLGRPAPDAPTAWEQMAEIAAMEFLFPYHERQKFVSENDATDPRVCEEWSVRYGIPSHYVENWCTPAMMARLAKG